MNKDSGPPKQNSDQNPAPTLNIFPCEWERWVIIIWRHLYSPKDKLRKSSRNWEAERLSSSSSENSTENYKRKRTSESSSQDDWKLQDEAV
jgi:hypothetical protein